MKRIEKITQKNLIEYKKEKQKDKIINKEEKNKINSIQNTGKIDQKSDPNLPDISIINQKVDSKNNFLEGSFVDDKIIKLTKELKYIIKKVTETEDKKSEDKSEENSNDNWKLGKKNENLERPTPEHDFIPLKDYPIFKNEAQIVEIEKTIEQIKEYEVKEGIANKLKFKEIEHDDVINFKDE